MVLAEMDLNFGRRLNLMHIFPLERCLRPTYCYMNPPTKIVEKDDPKVPNESHIEEGFYSPSSKMLSVSTKRLMKTLNPPSRRVFIPSIK